MTEEPEKKSNVAQFELSKPVMFEGIEYSSITIGIGELTGGDLRNIKAEYLALKRKRKDTRIPDDLFDDDDYLILMHGRAAKLPYDFFDAIPAPDYLNLTRGFREAIRAKDDSGK
jgi:hypothetical protein